MDSKIRTKFDNNVASSGLSFLKGGKTLILERGRKLMLLNTPKDIMSRHIHF